MNVRRLVPLGLAALLVAVAAVWVSRHGAPERSTEAGAPLLTALSDSIDVVSEVKLARGDGAVTTLQRRDHGWFVAQRNYPADLGRLRSLLINLSALHVVEQKTSDPTRYAQLDLDDATSAQSRSVRIDVTAGSRSWALLLGKPSGPKGVFVRVPGTGTALLAQPLVDADPQPTRWIRTDILDVPADRVQQVMLHPPEGPAYWLARDARGLVDLTLHGVPPGRKPAAPDMIDAVAGALARLNTQDVKERAAAGLDRPNRASYRTFDGLVVDLEGYRDGDSGWIRISAAADPETARRFADEKAAKNVDAASEAAALNSRLGAHDFRIQDYQYDAIFRPLKDLLAPLPQRTVTKGSKSSR